MQLLLKKDDDGYSPLNLAIKDKNYRCFELMLSMLIRADDTFISSHLLKNLNQILEMETPTIEMFFNTKAVDNVACKKIEKVRWNLEDKDSVSLSFPTQLFTVDDIEKECCPKKKNGAD